MKYAIVKFLDEKTPFWDDFARRYKAHSVCKALSTRRCSEWPDIRQFGEFIKNPRIGEITKSRCDDWKNLLSIKFNANTVRRKIIVLVGVFSYAVEIGLIQQSPFDGISIPRQVHAGRVLSDDEIGKLLPLLPLDLRRATILALYTGLRRNEILSLEWSQIGWDTLTIPANKSKSRRSRTMLLHQRALDALGPRRPGHRVFDFSVFYLNSRFTKAWKASGIGRVRYHDLRHTWATRWPGDLFALMQAGGWAHVSSVQPYRHVTTDMMRAILQIDYRI